MRIYSFFAPSGLVSLHPAPRFGAFLLHIMKVDISLILAEKLPSSSVLVTSGVYFLIRNETVVYIGSSKNIGSRIVAHKENKVFDSFFAIGVPESEMLSVEAHYIAEFVPEYNKCLPQTGKFKCIGIVDGSENGKITLEAMILGNKVYVKSSFEIIVSEPF